MPPIAIAVAAAVASYATAAAVTGAVIAGITISATAAMVIGALVGSIVSLGLGMALDAITGAGKTPELGASVGAQTQTVRGSIAPHRIVYGEQKVGGVLVYAASSGEHQGVLHMVVVLASHEVEEISTIWINDVPIETYDFDGATVIGGKYANRLGVVRFRGNQTETDPGLIAESPDGWDANHRLLGLAYLHLRLVYDPKVYQGIPSVAALVKGKRDIYDPRNNSTGYSTNWALCVLDYLRGEHGLDCEADELDLPSFIASANLSDEIVPLNALPPGADGSVWQRRYTINGSFTLDATPMSVIEGMLAAGGGALAYVEGRYRLYGGAYIAPTATLTAGDFAGDIELQTKPTRAELFNGVRGVFVDPARAWQASEFPPFQNQDALAEDGEEIWRDVEFRYVTDATRAQRLARQILYRQRSPLTFRAPLRYSAIRFSVWQTVAVTMPDLGWTAKPFRITSFSFDPSTAQPVVTMTEEQVADYAWLYDAAILVPDSPDTTLIDPLDIPAPADVYALSSVAVQADGSIVPALDITWTPVAHAFVTGHEVQWGKDGQWNNRDVGMPLARFTASGIVSGATYYVRVRGIAGLVRGPWSYELSRLGAADTTPPGAPTGLAALGVLRGVSLTWANPTDRDLATVEVYEGANQTAGARVLIGETRASVFLRTGMPPDTARFYWLRARDTSGNVSGFHGPVQGTSSHLLTDDLQGTILKTALFAQGIAPTIIIANTQAPGADGDVAVNSTDKKLYTRVNGAWVPTVQPLGPNGTLSSDQIDSLHGAKLQNNTVTGAKVVAGSILTTHLAVGGGNEIFNSCCSRTADGWQSFSSGAGGYVPVIGSARRDGFGQYALAPYGAGYVRGSAGVWAPGQFLISDFRPDGRSSGYSMPVKEGQRIQARALLGTHRCLGGIQLQFLDAAAGFISGTGTALVFGPPGGTLETNWTPHAILGTAPPGAQFALLRLVGEGANQAEPYLFWTKALIGVAPTNASEPTEWVPGGMTEVAGGNIRTNTVQAEQIDTEDLFADNATFNHLRAGIATFGGLKATEIAAHEINGTHMAAQEILSDSIQVRNLIVGTTKITGNAATALSLVEAGDTFNSQRTAVDGQFGGFNEELIMDMAVTFNDEGSGIVPRFNLAARMDTAYLGAGTNPAPLAGHPLIRWLRPGHTVNNPAFSDHLLTDFTLRPWRSCEGNGTHVFQLVHRYWSTTGANSTGSFNIGPRHIAVVSQKR